jgi:SAM-dependent methyltransferase
MAGTDALSSASLMMKLQSQNTWFSRWFNEDYLTLYAHRDEGEARTLADLIRARIPALAPGLTLDLACGAGRHLPYLALQQRTIGLDLSPWLLDVAHKRDASNPLVRADMRALPFRSNSFTLVANLFTSFGYFADDADSAHVLEEVTRVTRRGGWLVLDFLNAGNTRRSVVPFDEQRIGNMRVEQRRRFSTSGRFVVKDIRLPSEGREFTERVRLFEPADLVAMVDASGLEIRRLFGSYDGRPLTPESPRAIVFAQRS